MGVNSIFGKRISIRGCKFSIDCNWFIGILDFWKWLIVVYCFRNFSDGKFW